MIKQFLNTSHPQMNESQSGQGLVEYALLLMLVGAICIGGLRLLGSGVQGVYTEINCEIQTDGCGNKVASAEVDDGSGDGGSGDDGSGDDGSSDDSGDDGSSDDSGDDGSSDDSGDDGSSDDSGDDGSGDDGSGDDGSGDDGSGDDGSSDDSGDDGSSDDSDDEIVIDGGDDVPCSTTDVPVIELQCIGGSVYVTVTSTCETVDSATLTLATGNILDLPLDITLAKEPSGLTLSTEPILGVAICLAVDTNTLSVDGTVYYNDGEVATVDVN